MKLIQMKNQKIALVTLVGLILYIFSPYPCQAISMENKPLIYNDQERALQRRKLEAELRKLEAESQDIEMKNKNNVHWASNLVAHTTTITTLVAVLGLIITIFKQMDEKSKEKQREFDEKLPKIVEYLGSKTDTDAGIVLLRNFLKPECKDVNKQILVLILSHLKKEHASHIKKLLVEDLEKSIRLEFSKKNPTHFIQELLHQCLKTSLNLFGYIPRPLGRNNSWGFLPRGLIKSLNLFGYIPRPLGRNNNQGLPQSFILDVQVFRQRIYLTRWNKGFSSWLKLIDQRGIRVSASDFEKLEHRVIPLILESKETNKFDLVIPDMDFSHAYLSGIDLSHIQFNEVNFTDTVLRYSKFHGSSLYRAQGKGIILEWADLSDSILEEVYFKEAKLRNANLQKARLVSAKFHNSDARNAKFQQAKLQGVHFEDSKLEGAQFQGANLCDAYFEGASFDDKALRSIICNQEKLWKNVHFDKETKGKIERIKKEAETRGTMSDCNASPLGNDQAKQIL
jgi:uncharacterized protein YjbI with pentapeptide repeats